MGLCSCLASCLACGVQHWSLLAVGCSWILVLRWRSLGHLSPINITWGWEVSGGPTSWTRLSHLRGLGPTPSWSTKALTAAWHGRKVREKKKNKNKQNAKRNGNSKTKQTKSHKETHTHTHRKRNKKVRDQLNQ